MRRMRRALVAIVLVSACGGAPATRAPAPAPAPSAARASLPVAPSLSASPPSTPAPPPARTSHDEDAATPDAPIAQRLEETEAPRKRYADAVVFFAAAAQALPMDGDGLTQVPATPFMPAVCSKRGALAFGTACAALVPAKAKARVVGGRDVELVRGGGLPRQDRPDLKANEAPACCMYNGCQGITVPFSIAGSARWLATKLAIAVWPADADVELDAPDDAKEFTVRGHAYRAARGEFARREGSAWKPLLRELVQHARATGVVAVTDVNHDGKNEVFVYAPYANDHGFAVIADDSDAPGWSYNCGNI